MNGHDGLQIVLFFIFLLVAVKPLGSFMARVMEGQPTFLTPVLGWLERFCYRLSGINPEESMSWKGYAVAAVVFHGIGFVAVYAIQRCQAFLPFNPAAQGPVEATSAFNTAASFISNTNWQGYGGESTMSNFTQMMALTVQNFLSAAVGVAVLIALIRGLRSRQAETIGNFWADLVRSTLYIFLPLSLLFAVVFSSQGVVQTMNPYVKAKVIQPAAYDNPVNDASGQPVNNADGTPKTEKATLTEQTIAVGPVASQIAIKQLGTNGGGFFNANSAHPFENPNPLTNLLSMLALLLIPAALCYTFGEMVKDKRQGWALLAAMTILLVMFMVPTYLAEHAGNPAFAKMGLSTTANWEGKEARLGIANSTIWAASTTAASNGSVNSMHDSYTPLGGMYPMILMQLGEVVFGGVGSGLYGMLMFAVVAVFAAGLMVGRTPEYMGKKIEAYEMKMASIVVLIPCCLALLGTAIPLLTGDGQTSMSNPGAHGFSQLLYAYSSMANNNGSAFAGFSANVPMHNLLGGAIMWISRVWVIVPVLALAGSLAKKKIVPVGPGTLPTHTPLFIGLLVSVVLIIGALTFIPALALGPIVEQLQMGR